MLRSRSVLAAVVALASLAGCTGILGSFEVGPGGGAGDGGGGNDGGSNDGTTTGDAPAPFSITVTKNGTGQGKVTSAPAAIDCGAICGAAFPPGTSVTLTATPQAPSTFDGWGGACSGTGACTVTVDKALAVTAKFSLPGHNVKVSKTGTGRGTVRSSPIGIDCGAACDVKFDQGTKVKLAATAEPGSIFTGWKQACTGDRECDVTVDAPKVVEAEFMALSTWDPNWSIPGTVNYSTSNLDISSNSASTTNVRSSIGRASGKYYFEIKATAGDAANNSGGLGIMDENLPNSVGYIGINSGATSVSGMSFGYGGGSTLLYFMNWPGATQPSGNPPAEARVVAGTVFMFALDMDGKHVYCGQNGTWHNGGNPSAGTGPAVSGLTGTVYAGVTFYGNSVNKFTANFGQAAFVYTPPAGYGKGLY